jgi:hypothetical protein
MQQGKQQPQHQPADGPAFWNITHNFKPGELESDLSKMFFNQALDLHKENEALKQRIKRLEEVRTVAAANSLANMMSHEDALAKIKRLEEGGDEAIYPFEYAARVRIWTEAKEVKP